MTGNSSCFYNTKGEMINPLCGQIEHRNRCCYNSIKWFVKYSS